MFTAVSVLVFNFQVDAAKANTPAFAKSGNRTIICFPNKINSYSPILVRASNSSGVCAKGWKALGGDITTISGIISLLNEDGRANFNLGVGNGSMLHSQG